MIWQKKSSGGNKYHAKKTVIDGITFDSHFEAIRYGQLKLLEKVGEISGLQVHPVFRLLDHYRDPWSGECERAINYIGDFLYQAKDLHFICEDTKGFQTPDFRVKWKWVKSLNRNIEFKIVEAKR